MDSQTIYNMLSVFASVGVLMLTAAKFFSDVSRRKDRAVVTFVKGYSSAPNGSGHQYRSVRVANGGERPFTVEQIGFYFDERRDVFIPVDAGSNAESAYQGSLIAPGASVEVGVCDNIRAQLATCKTFRAFCRIATGKEFVSKPMSE